MDRGKFHENTLLLPSIKESARSAMEGKRGTSLKSQLPKPMTERREVRGNDSARGCRKKTTLRQMGNTTSKKKGKKVSSAVIDAFLINVGSCVSNVQEQRRKREEDARKCGRITRPSLTTNIYQNDSTVHVKEGVAFEERNSGSADGPAHVEGSSTHCDVRGVCEGEEGVGDDVDTGVLGERDGVTLSSLEKSKRKRTGVKGAFRLGVVNGSLHDRGIRACNRHLDDSNHIDKGGNILENTSLGGHEEQGRRSNMNVHLSPRVPATGNVVSRRQVSFHLGGSTYESSGSEEGRDFEKEFNSNGSMTRTDEGYSAKEQSLEELKRSMRRETEYSRATDVPQEYRSNTSSGTTRARGRTGIALPWISSRSTLMSLSVAPGSKKVVGNTGMEFQRKKDVIVVSPAEDRKTRRLKQSFREAQRLQREKHGKKPFFLTVDIGGRPFGPGRPAWIADINKLATGLDPSCTDIRKQAHIDICTFKDRLNEHFEYSADLSEDYLRSLMGKAVTRKRADLIRFINSGRIRPEHFDEEVWGRLQLLASSQQRERRTEHGRYANSCRRTLGRTGALGEEGIRERLREVLQRSPDPDEVAEEMHRDKGYGKMKLGSVASSRSWQGQHCRLDMERHEGRNRGKMKCAKADEQSSRRHMVDEEVDNGNLELEDSEQVSEGKQAVDEMNSVEVEGMRNGCEGNIGSTSRGVGKEVSVEEYIARLEEELQSVRRERKKELSYSAWLQSRREYY